MLRRLLWLVLLAAAAYGIYYLAVGSSPTANPHSSPRAALLTFCSGLQSNSPATMLRVCRGEATRQVDTILRELDERARRGARVTHAWPEGHTAAAGGRAQGLITIQDATGNTLPRWDAHLVRDAQGRWWIDRFTDR